MKMKYIEIKNQIPVTHDIQGRSENHKQYMC